MKRHFSVFALMARSTIYKVIALLLLAAAAEVGLFSRALRSVQTWGLEFMVQQSRVSLVFAAAFLALTVLLASTGRGGHEDYTLMRLSVSPGWVFFWQSTYNFLCYVVFWGGQVMTAALLCRIYMSRAPEELAGGQAVFLAFYRSGFLHALLPLEDWLFWLRNLLTALAMSLAAAHVPGKEFRAPVFLLALTLIFYLRPVGSNGRCILLIAVSLFYILNAVGTALEKEAAR